MCTDGLFMRMVCSYEANGLGCFYAAVMITNIKCNIAKNVKLHSDSVSVAREWTHPTLDTASTHAWVGYRDAMFHRSSNKSGTRQMVCL